MTSLIDKFIKHFMTSNNDLSESVKFSLCSTLIRYVCTAENKLANDEIAAYFRVLFKENQSRDKKFRKQMKKSSEARLTNSHVDFLRSTMFYSCHLKTILDDETDEPFDVAFKSIFSLYLILDGHENNVHFDFNSCYSTARNVSDAEEPNDYLIKSLTQALNSLSAEQFKRTLTNLEEKVNKELSNLDSSSSCIVICKLLRLFKTLSSDFELNTELKEDFSNFLQKVVLL